MKALLYSMGALLLSVATPPCNSPQIQGEKVSIRIVSSYGDGTSAAREFYLFNYYNRGLAVPADQVLSSPPNKSAATLIKHAGLADHDKISFESLSAPGYYLCRSESKMVFRKVPQTSSPEYADFLKSATFTCENGQLIVQTTVPEQVGCTPSEIDYELECNDWEQLTTNAGSKKVRFYLFKDLSVPPFEHVPVWLIQLRIKTSDENNAGTDAALEVFFNESGRRVVLDYSRNDFGRGEEKVYSILAADAGVWYVDQIEFIKFQRRSMVYNYNWDRDNWILEKLELMINGNQTPIFRIDHPAYPEIFPDHYTAPRTLATRNDLRQYEAEPASPNEHNGWKWLNEKEIFPLRHFFPCSSYCPMGTSLAVNTTQLVEGIIGNMIHQIGYGLYWGELNGAEYVEVTPLTQNGVHVDIDLASNYSSLIPDPEVDIDFDIAIGCHIESGRAQIRMEILNVSANAEILNGLFTKSIDIPAGFDHTQTVEIPSEYCIKVYFNEMGQMMLEFVDEDLDFIPDNQDNCLKLSNPDQRDRDEDRIGDLCDNCPLHKNTAQRDYDSDGIGDPCDNCLDKYNPEQTDRDHDRKGDECDNCPGTSNSSQLDSDKDGVGDVCDNCPFLSNKGQEDCDHNFVGDVCDWPPSLISTDQGSVNFGYQAIGVLSSKQITVENNSLEHLGLSFDIVGSTHFQVNLLPTILCPPHTSCPPGCGTVSKLDPGKKCLFDVEFLTPPSIDEQRAILRITNGIANCAGHKPVLEIPLVGSVISYTGGIVEGDHLDFGAGNVGLEPEQLQSLELANPFDRPVQYEVIQPSATDFEIVSDNHSSCNLTGVIPAKGRCKFLVKFQPTMHGERRSTIQIHIKTEPGTTQLKTIYLKGYGN